MSNEYGIKLDIFGQKMSILYIFFGKDTEFINNKIRQLTFFPNTNN